MDILLTHDQQGDAIDAALKRCVADKELSPAHEIAAESCRAQLRKVARWAETPFDVEGRPPWSSKKRHSASLRHVAPLAGYAHRKAMCGWMMPVVASAGRHGA